MMNVTNIVAKAHTPPVDREDLYLNLSARGFATKMPRRFPAIFIKLNQGTCTVFSTGTVTLNGVKSIDELNNLTTAVENALETKISQPHIVNVVGSFRTNTKVNLGALSRKCIGSLFEPDLTNSLELVVGSCKVLIHHTGNGIIAGAKTLDDLQHSYELLLEVLKQ